MGMHVTDRLIAPQRSTVDQALLYAARFFAPNGDAFVREMIQEFYRVGSRIGISSDITMAQAVVETTADGKPFNSYWFRTRGNPGGLGVTGDPEQDAASPTFATGAAAAQAMVAHESVYALGPADAGSLWARKIGGPPLSEVDPRYDAYVAAYGNTARAETVAELAGTWATDLDYATKIVARGNVIFPALPDQGDSMSDQTRGRPVVVIDAGHRSTDRSGNAAEMALTGDLAVAYVAELRRRGYQAFWYQRDLDRDSDLDETVGDLNTVALGIGSWLRGQPWALFLSLHYDGTHAPLEAIVPDNVGLTTAYPQGRDPADTAANNALDRQLGVAIVQRMVAAGLGVAFRGRLGEPGLMSERETGVGGRGYRLAVFAATAPSRATAVRLVIEHGGTSDPAARRFADFARAAADAIDSSYGVGDPGGDAGLPAWPATRMPAPDEVRAQGHRLTRNTPMRFRALIGTTLRTAPSRDAPAGTTRPVRRGRTYTFAYRAEVDGETWLVSSAGSWAPASAFEEVAS